MLSFIQQIDLQILHFIQEFFTSPILDYLFVVLTSLGNSKFIWLAAAYLLLLQKKTRNCGMVLFVGIITSQLLCEEIIKPLIQRDRPFYLYPNLTLLIPAPYGYSFPSGHTMDAFLSSTILYCYNKKYGAIAFLIAFFMGLSRIYLFVHYPSDVLAGAVFGILVGLLIYKYCKFGEDNTIEPIS